jgi:exopolysaccharide biosynthesis polyprenyl glycosylphosphotransferase
VTTVSEALRADLGDDVFVTAATVQRLGWRRVYHASLVAADAAAGLLAAALVVTLSAPHPLPARIGLAVAITLGWLAACSAGRTHDLRSMPGVTDDLRILGRVAVVVTALSGFTVLATNAHNLRTAVVVGLPVAFTVSATGRAGGQAMLRAARRRGRCFNRVVVVGGEEEVLDLVGRMRRDTHLGLDPVAACLPGGGNRLSLVRYQVPVVGDMWDAAATARRFRAAGVVVGSGPGIDATVVRRIGWQLEEESAELVVAPPVIEVDAARLSMRTLGSGPLVHVAGRARGRLPLFAKELAERSFAFVALLILAPMLVTIALAIRLTSRGPALFRQSRVGKDGKEFTLVKFRTMVLNADELRANLSHLNICDGGLLFKIQRDPRVTRIGSLLRRTSLDELPQLLNVLRGRMALVGPRPSLPTEVARYTDDVRRRLLVKPGLTGLWQVSGRSDLSWEESVRLDLRYVENWSLALDLQILCRTWSAVLRGRGAY